MLRSTEKLFKYFKAVIKKVCALVTDPVYSDEDVDRVFNLTELLCRLLADKMVGRSAHGRSF